MEYVTLNNGVKMPIIGYGVNKLEKEETERCVLEALKAGYRLIDTAQSYENEEEIQENYTFFRLENHMLYKPKKAYTATKITVVYNDLPIRA